MSVHYSAGKANLVAHALSILSMGSVAYFVEEKEGNCEGCSHNFSLGSLAYKISNNGVTIQNGANLSGSGG